MKRNILIFISVIVCGFSLPIFGMDLIPANQIGSSSDFPSDDQHDVLLPAASVPNQLSQSDDPSLMYFCALNNISMSNTGQLSPRTSPLYPLNTIFFLKNPGALKLDCATPVNLANWSRKELIEKPEKRLQFPCSNHKTYGGYKSYLDHKRFFTKYQSSSCPQPFACHNPENEVEKYNKFDFYQSGTFTFHHSKNYLGDMNFYIEVNDGSGGHKSMGIHGLQNIPGITLNRGKQPIIDSFALDDKFTFGTDQDGPYQGRLYRSIISAFKVKNTIHLGIIKIDSTHGFTQDIRGLPRTENAEFIPCSEVSTIEAAGNTNNMYLEISENGSIILHEEYQPPLFLRSREQISRDITAFFHKLPSNEQYLHDQSIARKILNEQTQDTLDQIQSKRLHDQQVLRKSSLEKLDRIAEQHKHIKINKKRVLGVGAFTSLCAGLFFWHKQTITNTFLSHWSSLTSHAHSLFGWLTSKFSRN